MGGPWPDLPLWIRHWQVDNAWTIELHPWPQTCMLNGRVIKKRQIIVNQISTNEIDSRRCVGLATSVFIQRSVGRSIGRAKDRGTARGCGRRLGTTEESRIRKAVRS